MLIGAYGMFWNLSEMRMHRGSGSAPWELLGRIGSKRPGLQVCDFRKARGVYVLFDDHGAYYAGLARGSGGLGQRIKAHTRDEHSGKWNRFCWFSFDAVSAQATEAGWHEIEYRKDPIPTEPVAVMQELEALLIIILNTRNVREMRFQGARPWTQVPDDEWDKWIDKVRT